MMVPSCISLYSWEFVLSKDKTAAAAAVFFVYSLIYALTIFPMNI